MFKVSNMSKISSEIFTRMSNTNNKKLRTNEKLFSKISSIISNKSDSEACESTIYRSLRMRFLTLIPYFKYFNVTIFLHMYSYLSSFIHSQTTINTYLFERHVNVFTQFHVFKHAFQLGSETATAFLFQLR